jgi:hypothetical protein
VLLVQTPNLFDLLVVLFEVLERVKKDEKCAGWLSWSSM